MKKIVLCIVLFCVTNVLFAQYTFTLKGKVKNHKIENQFTFFTSEGSKKFPLANDGSFELKLTIPQANLFCAIRYSEERGKNITLFATDKAIIELEFDGSETKLTPNFKNTSATTQNFVQAFEKRFLMKCWGIIYGVSDMKWVTTKLDSLEKVEMAFVDSFATAQNVNKFIVETVKLKTVYENSNAKIFAYGNYWKNKKALKDSSAVPVALQPDFSKITIQNEPFLFLDEYKYFLTTYCNYKALAKNTTYTDNQSVQLQYEYAKKNFTGKVQLYLLYDIVKSAYSARNFSPEITALVKDFETVQTDPTYSTALAAIKTKWEKLAKGNPAPNFALQDSTGKTVSLADFKGKVVFLDFWASWCGPCIGEMPSAKKVKEKFKGQNVVFLYLSIDTNETLWKNAMKKHGIEGIHLLVPPKENWNHQIPVTYNVNGIPAYFLIDKEGKFAVNVAPRPSDEKLITEIEKALK